MPHTYTNFLYHLVFSTKERYPFISKDSKPELYDYMGGTIRGLGGVCLEIGGVEDHVHLLVKLKPTLGVPKFLQELKPAATNWAKRRLDPKFEWQNGYGGFTVGESQVAGVRRYIRNQEEHHRKVGFEEEFRSLLQQAGIEFDEKYLWK
ncbi:MAG: IS200/IS605 family transposase [Acidobacteria bacterium]|nr:IS200/IS605 family transposase [Acidobacteriota bacterium]